MKSEDLILKYENIFGEKPYDPQKTLMYFGLDCGEGWYRILDELFYKISDIVKENNFDDFRIVQVKEKFGTLRIYYHGSSNDDIDNLISEAEELSSKTCEVCGKPAETDWKSSWVQTICESCKNTQL